jgi:hypothetical protein
MGSDSTVSLKRRLQLVVGVVAIAATIAAWLVAMAGAHVPATFSFSKGGNTEIVSFADGTGTQAHHVIVFPKEAESLTCEGATFQGTTVSTSATAILFTASYANCTLFAEKYFVFMGGCGYSINASGQVAITSIPGKDCSKEPIHIFSEKPNTCVVDIYEQALTGATFSNKNEEVTMSLSVKNLEYDMQSCENATGKFNDGEYSTGNSVLSGRVDPGGAKRPMSWSATVP